MPRLALGLLTACCAFAGPVAVASFAQGEPAPAPTTAFPNLVSIKVNNLDLVYGDSVSRRGEVLCSARDPNCLGFKARITLTLTAASAKATGITKREISSVVYTETTLRTHEFKHDLSSSEIGKIKKVQKTGKTVSMVISVSVTKGATTIKAPSRVMVTPNGNKGNPYLFEFRAPDGGRG